MLSVIDLQGFPCGGVFSRMSFLAIAIMPPYSPLSSGFYINNSCDDDAASSSSSSLSKIPTTTVDPDNTIDDCDSVHCCSDQQQTTTTTMLEQHHDDHHHHLHNQNDAIKSVTFADDVTIHDTLHLKDYNEHEILQSWYNKADYSAIKEEIKSSLGRSSSASSYPHNGIPLFNDTNYETTTRTNSKKSSTTRRRCPPPRGLEHWTKRGAHDRTLNRCSGITAVLQEQDAQNGRGEHYPNRIAEFYILATYHCQIEARNRALQDVQESNY